MAFEPGKNLSQAFDDASGVTGSGPVTVPSSNSTGVPDWLKKSLPIILGPGALPASGALPSLSGTLSGFISSRVGAFILGLILIAGGIYLFKPDTINTVVKTGGRAAML